MAIADARVLADVQAPSDPVGAIPRDYNFAADILERNLKAGRAGRPAFIDPRGAWSYGQLADRVARFAAVRGAGQHPADRGRLPLPAG
jgi:benzoate-CoA ligase